MHTNAYKCIQTHTNAYKRIQTHTNQSAPISSFRKELILLNRNPDTPRWFVVSRGLKEHMDYLKGSETFRMACADLYKIKKNITIWKH